MRRLLFGLAFCVAICSVATPADTPGEEAVRQAVKSLREKRATVKDKADQALLDTVIRDMEERLAQVGKGEPEPEARKDEAFAMPKGWELRFNTGKARPTYNPKTSELKLAYDFSDAKQLKDFEYGSDVKPTIQKGILTVKGGDELKHVVRFRTVAISCTLSPGADSGPIQTEGGHFLFVGGPPSQTHFDLCCGKLGDGSAFIAGKGSGKNYVGNGSTIHIKDWFVDETKTGLKVGDIELSAKRRSDAMVGKVVIAAKSAPNHYQKLTVSGILDPEWAKEFFADKK